VKNINDLWNSRNQNYWELALDNYYSVVKKSNIDIEKELDNLDSNFVEEMSVEQFYDFLHDKYFVWKYTDSRFFKNIRSYFEKYLQNGKMSELEKIHNLIFEYDKENIEECLKNVEKINGLGIPGASGLLALLFPKYFGTVDKFVIQRLLEIKHFEKHSVIAKMNPDNIKLEDGVILIEIMREKSKELNEIFNTDYWTPRKIDKILWSIDRKNNKNIENFSSQKFLFSKHSKIKKDSITIKDEIEQFLLSMPINYEFSTNWFKSELSKLYNRSEGSYIPSDYCYNRKNKGINFDKQPHYFLFLGKGVYRYVGKNYDYNGVIEQNPRRLS